MKRKDKYKLLEIAGTEEAHLIRRENRFIGIVKLGDGSECTAHIHDPGRLKELLYRGNLLLIQKRESPTRKTSWEVIAARSGGEWILINTSFHRKISEKLLLSPSSPIPGIVNLKAEVRTTDGRLDFLASTRGERHWIETKGCTLVLGERALFPDAPTKRGARHLRELARLVSEGERASAIFLIFAPGAKIFSPNRDTDTDFCGAFKMAEASGVGIIPVVFSFDGTNIMFERLIDYEIV